MGFDPLNLKYLRDALPSLSCYHGFDATWIGRQKVGTYQLFPFWADDQKEKLMISYALQLDISVGYNKLILLNDNVNNIPSSERGFYMKNTQNY